ncbi:MAG: LytTR family DNA-binding domain-containing protein [Pseudomonadota bacterium]
MTRVLLADDEPALTRQLARLLETHWPADALGPLELDEPVADGIAALEQLQQEPPDLAFLDIRMPGKSGLEVARTLVDSGGTDTTIVFVTAYDEHAIDAFEAAALDYLLKPVAPERLTQCLERVARHRAAVNRNAAAPDLRQVEALLEQLADKRADPKAPLRWLRIGRGDEVELVPVEDVVYFRSELKYTTAVTSDREHLLRRSLKDLLEELEPDQFWQIHRSLVVNVSDIAKAERDLRGRYEVTLRRRPEKLRASQSFGHLFKQM